MEYNPKISLFRNRLRYFLYYLGVVLRSKYWYDSPTYFPEFLSNRKSRNRIILDQLSNLIKYGGIDDFYFVYGHDIKGLNNQNCYVNYLEYYLRRECLNVSDSGVGVTLLKNKLLFYLYAAAMGISSPPIIGIIKNGTLKQLYSDSRSSLYDYIRLNRFTGFVKSIDGECGNNVFSIKTNECGDVIINDCFVERLDFERSFSNGSYILQRAINNQHPALSILHKESINTIRIVTTHTSDDEFGVLPPVLRIGTGTSHIDNWAAGGIIVGIDEKTYSLKQYGFFKPAYGGKTDHHPDSGIKFEGYSIPFMQEAISVALSFHKLMPKLRSVGWDVAITEDGPLFIEGNDNWDLSLIQTCSHGLMKEFKRIFY